MTSIAASSSLAHWYARRSCVLALDAPGSPNVLANFRLTPLVGQALLELAQLVTQLVGEALTQSRVVGLDLGHLLAPALGVDRHETLHRGLVDVESADVDRRWRRHASDGGRDAVAAAFDLFDDPLQDPAVVAEARPHELAVVAFTEPVHPEQPGQLV